MARRPRLQIPGGIYHLTARGTEGRVIFPRAEDGRFFLHLLGKVVEKYGWCCDAYCLMPNHFHLLVETPEPNLALGMHRLNGGYAQWFNDLHEHVGHLFQSRYYSGLVARDSHLAEANRYIVLNPVRAGLCRRAGSWRWSSYRAVAGLAPGPAFLARERVLSWFARDPRRAAVRYAEFVADGISMRDPSGHVRGLAPDVAV